MFLESCKLLQLVSVLIISMRGATCDCGCSESSSDAMPWSMKMSDPYYPPPDPYEGIPFVVRPAELPKPTITMPAPTVAMYKYNQPYMAGYIQQSYPQYQPPQYPGSECSCLRKLRRFQKIQSMKERFQQQRQMLKYQLSSTKSCGCCQKHTCNCRDY